MEKLVSILDILPNHVQAFADKKGFEKFIYTALPFIPRHAYFPFLNELMITWIKLKYRTINRPNEYKNAQDLLVNIGSGSSGKPGWINVDIENCPGVNCIYDCRKHLPFPDLSVKGIFTEHFFEHLDYTEEVPYFLAECHRVLKLGGIIRIIVPDAEKYLRAFCENGWEKLSEIRPLKADHSDFYFGNKYNTKMELINVVFRQYFEHKFAYDHDTIEFLLYQIGFSTVHRQEFGKTLMDELNIDLPVRASESLYIEAVK